MYEFFKVNLFNLQFYMVLYTICIGGLIFAINKTVFNWGYAKYKISFFILLALLMSASVFLSFKIRDIKHEILNVITTLDECGSFK